MTGSSLRTNFETVVVVASDIATVTEMAALGLNAHACSRALDDAGLKVPDVDGLLTAYSFTEPYTMLGSSLCEYTGLQPTLCASMVAGGASPGIMLRHAAQAIAMG